MGILGFRAVMNTLKEFAGGALVTAALTDNIKAFYQSPHPQSVLSLNLGRKDLARRRAKTPGRRRRINSTLKGAT